MIPSNWEPVAAAIGSAVLHFLWQGCVIAGLAWIVLRSVGSGKASMRYAVAYGALLLSVATFAATTWWASATATAVGSGVFIGDAVQAAEWTASWSPHHQWTAAFWMLGVGLLTLRFAFQCLRVQSLKTQGNEDPPPAWVRAFEELRRQLGVSSRIRLRVSRLAEVPMVVGWLQPVVLVPLAALSGLRPDQVRALLAHELAHVRRHDPLLNALQALVEIVLFFHPAVWWLSQQVRVEREYCCDASSVRLMGDPRVLAEALTAMEGLRHRQERTPGVLASQGGPLMQRILRILGVDQATPTAPTNWQAATGWALTGALALMGSAFALPTEASRQPLEDEKTVVTGKKSVEAKVVEGKRLDSLRLKKVQEAEAQLQLDRRAHREELKAVELALKAGTITKKEAHERMLALELRVKQLETEYVDRQRAEQLQAAWQKLQHEVKQGNLTQDEAKLRIAELKKKIFSDNVQVGVRVDPEDAIRQVMQAVEAGKLAPAEGKAKIEELRRHQSMMREKQQALQQEAALKIEQEIQAGRLTPEEGRKRLEKLKHSIELGHRERQARNVELQIADVQAAVVAGSLTREQGQAKIEELKRRLDQRVVVGVELPLQLDRLRLELQEIELALDQGKVEGENARRRLVELREKLAWAELQKAKAEKAKAEKAKAEKTKVVEGKELKRR